MSEPITQLIASHNDRAHLGEILVAAGVVRVNVRVDQKSDGAIRDLLDGRGDFLAQGRELSVHHEDAVRPREHANRSALTLERVKIVGQLGGLDLDLAEIRLALASRINRDGENGNCGQRGITQ